MIARKLPARVLAAIATAFLPLVLSACDAAGPQSTFGVSGEIAKDQLKLFYIIFWIAAAVFVLVEGLLVYIIIRYRRKPTDTALPPQTHGNTRLEIAWTIAPAILLAVVAVPTYQNIAKEDASPVASQHLNVVVTANQWWWEFRYPDQGIVTANEMHVPLNTSVDVKLRSRDVIHSFWIPKLAGTMDVVPTRENHMWFSAQEAGDYYGHCKEFCGIAHAQMRFRVIAESQADFDAWMAKQKGAPQPPQGALAEKGQQLFATKGCVVCHTINGADTEATQQARANGFVQGADIFPAPNLTTFGDRRTMAAGLVDKTEANVKSWVHNPNDIKPGNHMSHHAAAYKGALPTQDEVDALSAYLMGRTTNSNIPPVTPTVQPSATPPAGPPAGEVSSGPVNISTAGNDLTFNTAKIAVKAGAQVAVTLKNGATSASLQHNWVLVKQGTEDAVAGAGLSAGPTKDWVPANDPNVLAKVKLVDGGKSGTATFAAPAPGTYAFICSFPGHSGTMKGVFEVVP